MVDEITEREKAVINQAEDIIQNDPEYYWDQPSAAIEHIECLIKIIDRLTMKSRINNNNNLNRKT